MPEADEAMRPDVESPDSSTAQWSVYLVRCSDGSLYTGIATDVSRRLAEHAQEKGKGAKYLRGKGPLRLVLVRSIGSRALALRVEMHIKRLSKPQKEELIEQEVMVDQIVELAEAHLALRGGPLVPGTGGSS